MNKYPSFSETWPELARKDVGGLEMFFLPKEWEIYVHVADLKTNNLGDYPNTQLLAFVPKYPHKANVLWL